MVFPYQNGTTILFVTGKNNEPISRALVIGGGIGLRHFKNLQALLPDLDVRLLSIHSRIEDQNQEIVFITDLDEAKLFNPEITVIANPATFHSEMVSSLAPTGTAFLIEKPLAASVVDAESIKKQSENYADPAGVRGDLKVPAEGDGLAPTPPNARTAPGGGER